MTDTLTKENFWDEMSQTYPKAMDHFWKWIDGYKLDNGWNGLFNEGFYKDQYEWYPSTMAPWYHELPIAMQFGIFLQYAAERKSWVIASSFSYAPPNFIRSCELCIMQFLEWWETRV